jgi:OmpA-OmpF porin, OOP family
MNARLFVAALFLALLPLAAQAQAMPADLAGAKDHPVISRYAGSWLVAQEARDFDEVEVPTAADKTGKLEGRLMRLFYMAPAGKTPAEVQRNYELALERAGATKVFSCADKCPANLTQLEGARGAKKMASGSLEGWSAQTLLDMWNQQGQQRYWFGTLKSGAGTLQIVVLSGPSGVQVLKDKFVATMVMVIEPQAMATDKVQVDAAALSKGLQADGKVALYGLFFDTGKADIKPESKPQLDEIAKMLQANATLKVYVVGHTDNQGALDANLALSRARAQAVIDALSKNYKLDPKRLAAAGVANYAPLASNANEVGKARNRRVEVVVQ